MTVWLRERILLISDKQKRAARRDRQAAEMEVHQQELRTSIATSKRLVDEAEAMIQRHRRECDEADKAT